MLITAVISFCSNDWRFLKRCITSVSPFCSQILISACDHFFDGSDENYALLQEAFHRFPQCTFLTFSYDPRQSYRPFSPLFPEHPDWRHEWHNTGRWLSQFYCAPQTEFFLFLDCDEIIEADAFLHWLNHTELSSSAWSFAEYTHFREAKFEAKSLAEGPLLVRKAVLQPEMLWDSDERWGLFHHIKGEKQAAICGRDGKPMVRHYSYVRTEQELQKKFSAWGHHWERQWKELVEEEFSRPFSGKDFVRGYHYSEIEPDWEPLTETLPSLPPLTLHQYLKSLSDFPNVIMVSRQDAFKHQLQHAFAL